MVSVWAFLSMLARKRIYTFFSWKLVSEHLFPVMKLVFAHVRTPNLFPVVILYGGGSGGSNPEREQKQETSESTNYLNWNWKDLASELSTVVAMFFYCRFLSFFPEKILRSCVPLFLYHRLISVNNIILRNHS